MLDKDNLINNYKKRKKLLYMLKETIVLAEKQGLATEELSMQEAYRRFKKLVDKEGNYVSSL